MSQNDKEQRITMPFSISDGTPSILPIENWRGDPSRRGVIIIGWSEMDRGPIATEFAYATPIADGMRDENGSLIGGLYAVDYQRGQDDYKAGRPPPDLTTSSYDLGRQRAAEDQASLQEVKNHLHDQAMRSDEALREIIGEEAYAAHQARTARIRSGATDGWGIPLSRTQRPLLEMMQAGTHLKVEKQDGSFKSAWIGDKKVNIRTYQWMLARKVIEKAESDFQEPDLDIWTLSLRGQNALKGDACLTE